MRGQALRANRAAWAEERQRRLANAIMWKVLARIPSTIPSNTQNLLPPPVDDTGATIGADGPISFEEDP